MRALSAKIACLSASLISAAWTFATLFMKSAPGASLPVIAHARALRLNPQDVVAFVGGGGKTTAMFRLGELYAKGDGVVRDDREAYFWLTLAASRNVPEAAEAREKIGERLNPTQRSDAEARAKTWKPEV